MDYKLDKNEKYKFKGVYLKELVDLEQLFGINIDVYTIVDNWKESIPGSEGDDNDDDCVNTCIDNVSDALQEEQTHRVERFVAKVHRKSAFDYDRTMNVNLNDEHFCLIKKLDSYIKAYVCSKCHFYLTKTSYQMKQHEKTCTAGQKQDFRGGAFHNKPTIFEKLENEGISIPHDMRYLEYFVTYDYEVYFTQPTAVSTATTQYHFKHELLSVAIASNIPHFEETKYFVTTGDSQQLVNQMMEHLYNISDACYNLNRYRFRHYFEEIIKLYKERSARDSAYQTYLKSKLLSMHKTIDAYDATVDDNHPLMCLYRELQSYLRQCIVLGFNASYDMGLIEEYLISYLLNVESIQFCVKRGKKLICLASPSLKFLDISNYLAPNYSLEKYMAAYGPKDMKCCKFRFPYEYINSLSRLDEIGLPSHEKFFSKLKNTNISEEEYKETVQLFQERNCHTLGDYLEVYTKNDVEPFLQCVIRHYRIFQAHNVDMYRDTVSLPGIAQKILLNSITPNNYFSLFPQKHSHLYHLLLQQIRGGVSIIFNRLALKDKTKINENKYKTEAKTVKKIFGYDANSLYCSTFEDLMPVGRYVYRKAPEFRKELPTKYGIMACNWLNYLMHRDNVTIKHMYNQGFEFSVGFKRIKIDGWCASTSTVFQFDGCYFHCCNLCKLNTSKSPQCEQEKIRQKTIETQQYIVECGYKLVSMRECVWLEQCKNNPQVKAFLSMQNDKVPYEEKTTMTENEILTLLKQKQLYGFVVCDIHVPNHLKEYFDEFPPLFKNTKVSIDDIGETMANFAKKHGFMKKPVRMLIGSFYAEKQLIHTKLLYLYLDLGLVITKIYEIIQYKGAKVFTDFCQNVCNARRKADMNPEDELIGQTWKLIGNSSFGKSITRTERFENKFYSKNPYKISDKVNNCRFKKLDVFPRGLAEVSMSKSVINCNNIVCLGLCVYDLSKEILINFVYNCLKKYVDNSAYAILLCDTDSCYISLAAENLDDVIIPEKRFEFFNKARNTFFVVERCENHHQEYLTTKMSGLKWDISDKVCCQQAIAWDSRTLQKFKIENESDNLVALNSKTYFAWSENGKFKYSTKGVSKNRNINPITEKHFLHVLQTGESVQGTNHGFVSKCHEMHTYSQTRNALNYLYVKRKVLENGVETTSLDL